MKVRIGNDVVGLAWDVMREVLQDEKIVQIPEDFQDCFDIRLVAFNTRVRTTKLLPEYGIQNGKILVNIPSNAITETGPYTVLLEYKKPDSALSVGYRSLAVDYVNAFEIVASSQMEDSQGKQITSVISYASSKNAYDYWLDFHVGSVEDFVNWMQRPAIIAALRVEAYINQSQGTIDNLSNRVSDMETSISELLEEPEEIQPYPSYLNFPNVGSDKVLYIDTTENKSYRWDSVNLKYFIINEIDIEIINGNY